MTLVAKGLSSTLEGGGWSRPRPARFTPGKDSRYPSVQDARWAPQLVWTGTKNLASTGIRFPDRPARSESLYRLLCYRSPIMSVVSMSLPLK